MRRSLIHDEDGFSLISAVVAISLAMISVLGLGHTMTASLGATRHAKRVQQATALATQAVEANRDLSYEGLLLCTSDTTGDPAIVSGEYDPDGTGPLLAEPIAHVATGCGVDRDPPAIVVSEGATFTLRQYVTWVDETAQGGEDQDYKRFTVLVRWDQGNAVQRVSTLVSRNQRGLPTPKYILTPKDRDESAVPGQQVVFPHAVTNLGSIDAYDLVSTVPAGRSWTITYYADINQNELYDVDVDTPLTDTNASGIVDTGNVVTNATKHFLVVWDLDPDEAVGQVEVPLEVISGIDSDTSVTGTDTLDIGYPGLNVTLHNKPTPPTGNTTAQVNLAMNQDSATATTLHTYSTDLYTGRPGRYTDKKTTTHTESNKQYMTNWIYQLPQQTSFSGTAELRLWVAMKDFVCDKTPSLTVYLREKTSATTSTGTLIASTTVTAPSEGGTACPFREVSATFSMDRTIAKDRFIELKIAVNEASGDGVLNAYDTTAYTSRLTLPAVTT